MEKSKRPGGLTFFAIINFILAFLSIAGAGLLFISIAFVGQIPMENMTEAQRASVETLKNMPASSLIFSISRSVIGGILLLLAGIGYLKQNRVLGYIIGNVYVAAMIIYTVLSPFILGAAVKKGIISSFVALLYPVITLIVLNFIYRKNFNE
jgi:hypothetical protein